MSFDLPIDTTINGLKVFHEGNLDFRNNPFPQYIAKNPIYFFKTEGTNANKYIKIATITIPLNANVSTIYRLDVYDFNQDVNLHTIDVIIKGLDAVTINHYGKNNIVFYGAKSTTVDGNGNTILTFDLYAYCKDSWRYVYYRINFARSNDFDRFNYLTALKGIQLLNGQSFLNTVTTNVSENLSLILKEGVASVGTAGVNVSANSNTIITVNVSNMPEKSSVQCISNLEIPDGLDILPMLSVAGSFKIKVRNITANAIYLPAITWYIYYRQTAL